MNYPVSTAMQLRAVLRGMRKSKSLSQLQLGHLLGVNQKRAAKIERDPGVTSFDQIARLVASLGGRIVIEMTEDILPANPAAKPKLKTKKENKPKNIRTAGDETKGAD
jgi:HTH-type transcriptional regulator/antitoxin HipB